MIDLCWVTGLLNPSLFLLVRVERSHSHPESKEVNHVVT